MSRIFAHISKCAFTLKGATNYKKKGKRSGPGVIRGGRGGWVNFFLSYLKYGKKFVRKIRL